MLTHRRALPSDLATLRALMALAIAHNQREFLTPEQVAVSDRVMGLDTQLIDDGTYFLVEEDGVAVGCGGWSFRATTHGGNDSIERRDVARLDPARDPARVRAMYTHPDHARKGIGRLILQLGEGAARDAGFGSVMLMATLSGEPLYRACGYREVQRVDSEVGDGLVIPLIEMRKIL